MHPAIIAEADAALRRRVIAGVSRAVGARTDHPDVGAYLRWLLTKRSSWTPRPVGALAVVRRGDVEHIPPRMIPRRLDEFITYRPDVEGD